METTLGTLCDIEQLWSLSQCQTEEQIKSILQHMTQRLGFDHFLYGARFIIGRGQSIEKVLTNYSLAWRQQYERNGLIRIDPTVLHASHKITPLIWESKIYVTAEQKNFAEEAKMHGLIWGASFPVHSKDGDVGILSLALGAHDTSARVFIRENFIYGPMIANFVHDTMSRIVNKLELTLKAPLTARELECLKWIAAGKSTWETAQILSLSEHGVLHHVRNIMSKFDVTSRHQAVARAIFCGLI